MSYTVTSLESLIAAGNSANGSVNGMLAKAYFVVTTTTDATFSIPTSLTRVYGMIATPVGTDYATANGYDCFINQTFDTTKNCYVVSGGVISVKRVLSDAAGTLIATNLSIILFGT